MKINSIIDLVKDLDTSRQTKNLNKLLIRILLHLQVEFSRYNMGTNYGTYTSIIKDGDTVGLYKFVIEGIEPYNMEGTPWWYYGIYPADADFFSETEPEPIYKQLFEQPQTEGEEHFIYPIIYASSGTFD